MNEAQIYEPLEAYLADLDPGITPFVDTITDLFNQVELLGLDTYQTPLGALARASLHVKQPLFLPLQILPAAFVLGANDVAHPIEVSVLLESDWFLEIENAALALQLQLPFLRPVDDPDAPVEVQLEGGLRISAEEIELLDPELSFSLPRSEIGQTGIIISLDQVVPVLAAHNVPEIATFYGEDEGFRGLYAANATIEFLPNLVFAGTPGLRIEGSELLVGAQGVSCEILIRFQLADVDGELLTNSDKIGALADGGFPFVLNWVEASIHQNVPRDFSAEGYLRLPLFDLLFSLTMGLEFFPDQESWRYTTQLQSLAAGEIVLPAGAGSLTYQELLLSGSMGDSEADLSGMIAGLHIDLDPFIIDAGNLQLALMRDSEQLRLLFQLSEVALGPLGMVADARLLIEEKAGEDHLKVQFETTLLWSDLHARLAFAPLPDNFPLPPDDAQVAVQIYFDNGDWRFHFAAELAAVDSLWEFLPDTIEPQVPEAALSLDMAYDAAEDKFSGQASVVMRLGLPPLPQIPGISLIHISTGDAEGLIDLTLKGGFTEEADGTTSPYMKASIDNALSIDVDFPGLPQPTPPIHTHLTGLDFDLSKDADGDFTGGLILAGDFLLRPLTPAQMGLPIPPQIAEQLERLLKSVGVSTLSGTTTQALRFKDGRAEFKLNCSFNDAGLEVDLFDLIADLASGAPTPAGLDDPANSIDLDIEVAFVLKEISLQLGSVAESDSGAGHFSLGISFGLSFAGGSTDITLSLSDDLFSFSFSELSIPIALPQIPIHLDDLNALQGPNGRWDYAGVWLTTVEPQLDATIDSLGAQINAIRAQVATLETTIVTTTAEEELIALRAQLRELQHRELPRLQKLAFHATGNKFLMEAILVIHNLLNDDGSQATYQNLVELYQGFIDQTIGQIRLDTELNFVIFDAQFVLPFDNPADIRVEGGARLSGFADDDPLKPLEDLGFKLGLSADAIYFGVQGGLDPIPLPTIGRYAEGAIQLDRLNIGYGYNKNSLKIDFAGELRLPPALVEDVDTSTLIGAGIRLPLNSALAFKLDLIPITLGEVNFLLPLLEFDVDLRTPGVPALLSGANCEPAWDGLQLIVPELLRMDIKRMRFNPFFGPLPAPNYTTSYDIQLGNAGSGLTFICDNYLQITPVLGYYPIPLLADAVTPFFDNLCVRIDWAGFKLNFNLQRPLPSMSPLAIFELMGLFSDPMMPLDPAGQLAGMIRATLNNAVVTLPPAVVSLFPQFGPYLNREVDATINLATVITVAQQLAAVIGQAIDATAAAAGDMQRLIDEIMANPPEISPAALLRALPPELRRHELEGAFVGFHASACLFLLGPGEAQAEFERLADPAATAEPLLLYDTSFAGQDLSQWKAVNHGMAQRVGQWRILGPYLRQLNNVGHNDDPQYGPLLIYQGLRLEDASFTTILSSLDDDGIGVVFRYQDPQNYYRFRMTSEQQQWSLTRIGKGRGHILHSRTQRFKPGQSYSVTVTVRNHRQSGGGPRGSRLPVAIEILVNGKKWCQLVDPDSHLDEGRIGFCAYWNPGARFHSLRIYGQAAGRLTPGQKTTPGLVEGFAPALSDKPIFQPSRAANNLLADNALMAGFTATDLAAVDALPGSGAAILVGARVQLLGNQTYAFLGYLDDGGHFALVTSLDSDPLRLAVAGIQVALPLTFSGRLHLQGRSAGADSWSAVAAEGHGAWDILPAGLARLELASEQQPASLELRSDGSFNLQGAGRLLLFEERLIVDASADLSQTHLFVSGELAWDYATADDRQLVNLRLQTRGRLGPGPHFNFAGGGSFSLLGQALTAVSGELSHRGLTLAGNLRVAGKNKWTIAGMEFSGVEMALRGRVEFPTGTQPPALEMAGAGRFTVLGATIEGESHVRLNANEVCLGAAGDLTWQGRDWLAGQIELCQDRVKIAGRTSFALDLTPTDLFDGIQLAALYFTIDLSGRFEFTASQGIKRVYLLVDWTLGARFPGSSNQVLPLASQQKRISKYNLGASGTLRELLYIPSVNFMPFGDFTIPLPVIDMDDGVDVYLVYDGILPVLTLDKPASPPDVEPLFSLPGLGTENSAPLNPIMSNFNLRVKLAWEDGDLGVRLSRGGNDEFIPLRTMFD